MTINVLGDKVSQEIAVQYVKEYLKQHPCRNISSIDLIVDGDYLTIRCKYNKLPKIA